MDANRNLTDSDLLEQLCIETNSEYLSNLFYGIPFREISDILCAIPVEAYSYAQWLQTAQYLLRTPRFFSDAQEIKDFLVSVGERKDESPAKLQENDD